VTVWVSVRVSVTVLMLVLVLGVVVDGVVVVPDGSVVVVVSEGVALDVSVWVSVAGGATASEVVVGEVGEVVVTVFEVDDSSAITVMIA
jgi:hypothetical protein